MNTFKKILLCAILMGLIIPQLNIAQAQRKSPTETVEMGGVGASRTADSSIATLAQTLLGFVATCVPGVCGGVGGALTAVSGSVTPCSPTTFTGLCSQMVAQAEMHTLTGAKDTNKQQVSVTSKIIDFVWKIGHTLLKKVILDRLVDKLIVWINGGGQGVIVDDWKEFFLQAGKDAAGLTAQQIGLGFLCSPFNLQVQLTLATPTTFAEQITCSLDQIVGNIDSFMADFENGSWIGYQEIWKPRNNFYGAVLIGMDEIKRKESEAKTAAEAEAVSGKGFLSQKKCDADGTNCRILTPGELVAETTNVAFVHAPFQRLISASEYEQYIAAILDASINRLTRLGVEGLQGASKKKTSDYTTVSPSSPCSGLTGDDYQVCINSSLMFQNASQSRMNELSSVASSRVLQLRDLTNNINQSINLQTDFVDKLERLVTCGRADRANQLAEETGFLDYLEIKLGTYLNTLDQATAQLDSINQIGSDDWTNISDVATNLNSSLLNNSYDLTTEILSSGQEQVTIQIKIETEGPAIDDALRSCPATLN